MNKKDLEHYEKLIGLNETIKLAMSRERARDKLERKRLKDRSEQLGSSRPDGRLNGYNIATNSLVGRMGGKRKAKKTKRGY